jgi:hypothetical protein
MQPELYQRLWLLTHRDSALQADLIPMVREDLRHAISRELADGLLGG